MRMSPSSVFKVRRREPEIIIPASPTPHEQKILSVIDNQPGLRFQIPVLQFYRHIVEMEGRDPVTVIKEGIAKALVYYYPYAGRLRERTNQELIVDCNSEGVMFIEADADARMDVFGDVPQPPFPGLDHLLYNGPGCGLIFDSPLMLIQVTRFICGGFILAIQINHIMSDGVGLAQVMKTMGEMARGAQFPSVEPVWKRETLTVKDPPSESQADRLYNPPDANAIGMMVDEQLYSHRSFIFSKLKVASLRNQLPPDLQSCTTFEILTACLWRCRTIALTPNPDDIVGIVCTVNAREKFDPPLPLGYYGNAIVFPVAFSTAEELCQKPLAYAVELFKGTKNNVTAESLRSYLYLLVEKGPSYFSPQWYTVSDVRHIGFGDVDFGWGKAVHGGPPWADPSIASFLLSSQNEEGETCTLVTVNLPAPSMVKFAVELDKMTEGGMMI